MLIRAALLAWVEWIINNQLNSKKSAVRRFFYCQNLNPTVTIPVPLNCFSAATTLFLSDKT